MKFSMLRKELKAVSRFATVKDIRHYLNGVHIVQNNRGTYLEATNGHMAARFLILDQPMPCASIILGNDAIKTLTAAGKKAMSGYISPLRVYQSKLSRVLINTPSQQLRVISPTLIGLCPPH
jgi:DNA polymerase III sliding clamp (beta) subunit (PCNA family)